MPTFDHLLGVDSVYWTRGHLKVYGTFPGGESGNTRMSLIDTTVDHLGRDNYGRFGVLDQSMRMYVADGLLLFQPLDGASAFTDPDTAELRGDTLILRSRETARGTIGGPALFLRGTDPTP